MNLYWILALITYLFESKDITSLEIISPKNKSKKTTNSLLRLCPNLVKEKVRIGFEFKHYDHHECTTHPSESPLGHNCSETTILTSVPS